MLKISGTFRALQTQAIKAPAITGHVFAYTTCASERRMDAAELSPNERFSANRLRSLGLRETNENTLRTSKPSLVRSHCTNRNRRNRGSRRPLGRVGTGATTVTA